MSITTERAINIPWGAVLGDLRPHRSIVISEPEAQVGGGEHRTQAQRADRPSAGGREQRVVGTMAVVVGLVRPPLRVGPGDQRSDVVQHGDPVETPGQELAPLIRDGVGGQQSVAVDTDRPDARSGGEVASMRPRSQCVEPVWSGVAQPAPAQLDQLALLLGVSFQVGAGPIEPPVADHRHDPKRACR